MKEKTSHHLDRKDLLHLGCISTTKSSGYVASRLLGTNLISFGLMANGRLQTLTGTQPLSWPGFTMIVQLRYLHFLHVYWPFTSWKVYFRVTNSFLSLLPSEEWTRRLKLMALSNSSWNVLKTGEFSPVSWILRWKFVFCDVTCSEHPNDNFLLHISLPCPLWQWTHSLSCKS